MILKENHKCFCLFHRTRNNTLAVERILRNIMKQRNIGIFLIRQFHGSLFNFHVLYLVEKKKHPCFIFIFPLSVSIVVNALFDENVSYVSQVIIVNYCAGTFRRTRFVQWHLREFHDTVPKYLHQLKLEGLRSFHE